MTIQREWLTSNKGIAYPFTTKFNDDFHSMIVDAYISHKYPAPSVSEVGNYRVKITALTLAAKPLNDGSSSSSSPAGVNSIRLEFLDPSILDSSPTGSSSSSSAVHFFEGVADSVGAWGGQGTVSNPYVWQVIRWANENVTVQLLVDYKKIQDYSGTPPADAIFQDTVVLREAGKVDRLKIRNVEDENTPVSQLPTVTGKVAFREGFNMEIGEGSGQTEYIIDVTDNTVDIRPAAVINMGAIPGAGLGRKVDCSQGRAILTLNGQGPSKNGHILFGAGGNCSIERQVDTTASPEALRQYLLQLRQMGSPCCTCDNYVVLYNQLSREYVLAKKVAAKLKTIRDIYDGLREIVAQEKEERERGVRLQLELQSRPGFLLAVMLQLTNDSELTTPAPITINLNFTGSAGGVEVVRGSGMLSSSLNDQAGKHRHTQPAGSYPSLRVYTGALLPGTRWVRYTFQLRYKSKGTVSCQASATVNGVLKKAGDNASLFKPIDLTI